MIKFTVLGGYLGAGKTTLVNQILSSNDASSGGKKRIALLINDFGDINIDAQLIESQSDSQINLANGCVCCTLTDGFASALDDLKALDPQPDHIIVEASGVADVNNLSQYGNGIEMSLAGVVVVADAETVREKAADKYVSRTIQRQLQAADLILLNKIDLLSEEQKQSMSTWLADLCNGVPLVPCVKCDVPMELILDLDTHSPPQQKSQYEHERYESWSCRFSAKTTRSVLEQFVAELGPEVLRCKGLFVEKSGRYLELQVVGKRSEIRLANSIDDSGSQVVAIGLKGKLSPESLDELASRILGA